MSDADRHVYFEACFNFRDLGGYETTDGRRVRWNTLYRSDTLHRLTPTDAEIFADLGLHTVIDLRSSRELDDHGRLEVGPEHLVWQHVPMLDDVNLKPRDPSEVAPQLPEADAPGAGYVAIVEEYGNAVVEIFRVLSRADAFPAVFHCTSGKDRTGIVAALVLDLLGVPDDVIAADYVLTEKARVRSTPWIQANEPEFAAFLAQIPPERRVISPDIILGFLAGIRAGYGSVNEFLVARGVGQPQLDILRELLLDD
jgi:protein-tyrosine phosphatase